MLSMLTSQLERHAQSIDSGRVGELEGTKSSEHYAPPIPISDEQPCKLQKQCVCEHVAHLVHELQLDQIPYVKQPSASSSNCSSAYAAATNASNTDQVPVGFNGSDSSCEQQQQRQRRQRQRPRADDDWLPTSTRMLEGDVRARLHSYPQLHLQTVQQQVCIHDQPLPPEGVARRPSGLTRTPLSSEIGLEAPRPGGHRQPPSLTLSGPLPASVAASCGGGSRADSRIGSGGWTRYNPPNLGASCAALRRPARPYCSAVAASWGPPCAPGMVGG
eukprot:1343374-Pleurochrysis_carterae.AAC.2